MSDLASAIPEFAAVKAETLIAHGPVPGAQRVLTAREIRKLGQQFQVELPAAFLGSVCFEQTLRPLTTTQVREALLTSLRKGTAELDLLDFSHNLVPAGRLVFQPEPDRSPKADGSTIFRGKVITSSGSTFPIWATVNLMVADWVLVATDRLLKGFVVDEQQVRTMLMKRPAFAPVPLRSAEEAKGMVVRQTIEKGAAIRRIDLEAPTEVSPGDHVRVQSVSGLAQISFVAEARTAGRRGDLVLVQNPANGRMFKARVAGKHLVEALAGDSR